MKIVVEKYRNVKISWPFVKNSDPLVSSLMDSTYWDMSKIPIR